MAEKEKKAKPAAAKKVRKKTKKECCSWSSSYQINFQ